MTTNTQKILNKGKHIRLTKSVIKYSAIILITVIMLYPLLWIVGASFNLNALNSPLFIPNDFTISGWQNAFKAPGWGSVEGYSMFRAILNTLQYTIPRTVLGTLSCLITAYVITRMHFKGKKLIFALVIGTLLMPATIFRIPMYAFWTNLSVLWDGGSTAFQQYIPLWIGSAFAVNSFSIFMFIQFFRTIPRDLDEAAYIDGANRMQVLRYVLMPVLKPIVITVGLLIFIAAFNDYQGPLIYKGQSSTNPLSLVLPQLGVDSITTYADFYARSIVAIMILVLIFFFAQKYFVGHDTDSAIKG